MTVSETPKTDALIARHKAETHALDTHFPDRGYVATRHDEWNDHAARQARELLDHTKELEREVLSLRAQLSKVRDEALTFDSFRAANVTRCLKWHPAGIESWSPSDWLTDVTGELGELASLLKMRNRERDGLPGNKFSPTDKQIADELADVFTYLDLLAAALNVDLGKAAAEKFNEVSERVGFPDRITVRAA
jgi:NTP pyrophosphatase (non-canonical NTP hydrolase)